MIYDLNTNTLLGGAAYNKENCDYPRNSLDYGKNRLYAIWVCGIMQRNLILVQPLIYKGAMFFKEKKVLVFDEHLFLFNQPELL